MNKVRVLESGASGETTTMLKWMAMGLFMISVHGLGQTAHDYYDELLKANGLNSYQDEYVCFRDDEVPSFAVVSTADAVRRRWKENHVAVPKGFEKEQGLFVKTYYKGVANETEIFDKDGDGYSLTGNLKDKKNTPMKMTYSINWDTGRYRLKVYVGRMTMPAQEVSGKCELIHPGAK